MVFRNSGQHWVSSKGKERPLSGRHQQPLGKIARVPPKRSCKWQWIREGTMAGVWKALVLMVGLAAVACVAQRSLSYEEIVTLTLQFFNQGRQGQPLFGLLEAIPPPTSNFTTVIPLNFRIKERVCLSDGRRQPQDCAFREGGAPRVRRSAVSSEAATEEIDSSKLLPVVRDMYEKAKYDIISNILSNF
ncbi:hypothetical protein HPG69_012850 [Diceros bicornis minor]|uniref:15 kDa protein B-like n=1 Tax=Diceros bicornis minor TaxID=77932 RepID=A0A7J7F0Y6_DICBM|nr:hypothetical protein HPG69_012850 [Diceros bicornis minor]